MKKFINNCSFDDLSAFIVSCGEKPYRVSQIHEWIYKKYVQNWEDMTNIPRGLQTKIKERYNLYSLTFKKAVSSKKDDAIKYLFETIDKHAIETVFIKKGKRRTICLSTQIGCKYKCSFCASGMAGFIRDLDVAEIVDQLFLVQNYAREKITNIVFMGIGEPFDNYENTVQAIKIFNNEKGVAVGARRITVSTVGLIPAIERFAKEGFSQVRLSISLHAALADKRKKMMPAAKKYPLKDLITSLKKVRQKFKKAITLEYILIKNVNDTIHDARALVCIAKELKAKVNIIGYNALGNDESNVPHKNDIDLFRAQLEKSNICTTIRYSAGADISAACGQLRLREAAV